MPNERIPLSAEPMDGLDTVVNYDRYAAVFMRPEYRCTVKNILKHKISRGRLLDIGAGSGRLALELSRTKDCAFQIVGLDISQSMLRKARLNAASTAHSSIGFVRGTAARLPFPDESFDVVTSYASLHHWQQPAAVFDELWRVTKKNGLILVRDNRRMLANPFYRICIWSLSRFMIKLQRPLWSRSIWASYTVAEVEALLAGTKIKNYSVKPDMLGFDLCIESIKIE